MSLHSKIMVDEPGNGSARLKALLSRMPPVVAMGVAVERYVAGKLVLAAPLSVNVNDKGSAFGGSLVSLMTVAGWGLVTLQLHAAGLEGAEVYVADSQVRYLAPLRSDLQAESQLAQGQDWSKFLSTFRQRGRARIELSMQVPLPDGQPATEMRARYAAFAS